MIRFYCSCCQKKFAISDHLAGRKGLCPDCGTMFEVPGDSQAAPGNQAPPDKRAPTLELDAIQDPNEPPPVEEASEEETTESSEEEEESEEEFEPPPPPPSVTPPRKATSVQRLAVPSPVAPSKKATTVQRAAVDPAPPRNWVAASSGSTEPARKGGPGWGVVLLLLGFQAASVGYIWRLGGFAPGGNGAAAPAVDSTKKGPEVASQPTSPKPPTPAPPKEDPKPPTPAPPKEDPKPPTPAPPKEDPKPPTPAPPKEDPKPPTPAPPVEPPKPDPPPVEPPKPDPPVEHPPTPAPPPDPGPTKPPDPVNPPTEQPPAPGDVGAAISQAEERLAAARTSKDLVQQAQTLDPLQGFVAEKQVIQFLGKLLLAKIELPTVRQRAAELLGTSGRPEALSILDRGFEAAKAVDNVARASIYAMGRIDDPAAPRKLDAMVRARLAPSADELDNAYAWDAVNALGEMKRLRNVETLMALYLSLAQLYPGDAPAYSDEDVKKEAHRKMLEDATRSALTTITGETFYSYPEWADWWEANRANYK